MNSHVLSDFSPFIRVSNQNMNRLRVPAQGKLHHLRIKTALPVSNQPTSRYLTAAAELLTYPHIFITKPFNAVESVQCSPPLAGASKRSEGSSASQHS